MAVEEKDLASLVCIVVWVEFFLSKVNQVTWAPGYSKARLYVEHYKISCNILQLK